MAKVLWESFIGKTYSELNILDIAYYDKHNHPHFKCLCSCGKICFPSASAVKNGRTKSCGHIRNDKISQIFSTHHKSNTRLFRIYTTMKGRCNNPNHCSYKNYGGRGITVCDEWNKSFESFYDWAINSGYADDLSIDRINNDGNYEPGNCRWVDVITQSNNRRTNVNIEYLGMTQTIVEWARYFGFNYKYFHEVLKKNNYSISVVLEIPYFKEQLNGSKSIGK